MVRRGKTSGRIWPGARGEDRGFCASESGTRGLDLGMVIERDEREASQVPGWARPRLRPLGRALADEILQTRIGKRARLVGKRRDRFRPTNTSPRAPMPVKTADAGSGTGTMKW